MKTLFKKITILSFTGLIILSCSKDETQELQLYSENSSKELKEIKDFRTNQAFYKKRFKDLEAIHNKKHGIVPYRISKRVEKSTFTNNKPVYNIHRFTEKDKRYFSRGLASGVRQAHHTTQYAVIEIDTKRFYADRGTFTLEMKGTNQTIAFSIQKEVDFSPSLGRFTLKRLDTYNPGFISETVSKNEKIDVRARSNKLEIGTHTTIFGGTAIWVKVDGVTKYEAYRHFKYKKNNNSGVSFRYYADNSGSHFNITASLGWFKE